MKTRITHNFLPAKIIFVPAVEKSTLMSHIPAGFTSVAGGTAGKAGQTSQTAIPGAGETEGGSETLPQDVQCEGRKVICCYGNLCLYIKAERDLLCIHKHLSLLLVWYKASFPDQIWCDSSGRT